MRGERITSPQPLTSGDDLRFGSVRVAFHVVSPDLSTETTRRRDEI